MEAISKGILAVRKERGRLLESLKGPCYTSRIVNRSIILMAASIFWCRGISAEPSPPAQKRSTEEFLKTLSPEGRKDFALMEERDRLAEKYRARDRELHVRSAPPDFKPEDARRKLKITLIPERTMIRKGKKFRYQVEIQNIGRENISFGGGPSFVLEGKFGRIWGGNFKFLLTGPDGKELEAVYLSRHHSLPEGPDSFVPPPGWDKMTGPEKDEAIRKLNVEAELVGRFFVNLSPGEIIYTWDNSKGDRFRDLTVSHGFDKDAKNGKNLHPLLRQPGTYRIKLVFDERPAAPPNEKQIELEKKILGSRDRVLKNHQFSVEKSLGLIQSNIVTFEITQ